MLKMVIYKSYPMKQSFQHEDKVKIFPCKEKLIKCVASRPTCKDIKSKAQVKSIYPQTVI